jgi:hypothetical protein
MNEKIYLTDNYSYLEFASKPKAIGEQQELDRISIETTSVEASKSAVVRFMKMFFNSLITKEVRENWKNF